ncbi:MAG: DNA cytosine methyltransferase, partial [Acinetobacter junii]|nr:DNA cytosine methyltransferase [Acinetobacter junii]
AKGSKPVEKRIRGLAWIALRWADLTRPRVIMLENVEEFKTWGRLGEDGKPCPKHRGETFRSFVKALRYQGYQVEWRELRACDYGSPTTRKRFFLIARRDGLPIVWPKQTHADPKSDAVLKGKLKAWRTAAECIDWTLSCPSIFTRSKPLADATLRRIATGTMRYVVNNQDPFLIPVSTENRFSLVAPVLTECANASSPRCMPANEPLRTITTVKGGHHALVSAFLAKNYTGVVGSELSNPIHTITSKDHHSVVASQLVKSGNQGKSHSADVHAFLTAFYGNERDGNSIDNPLRTIPTRDRFGLVTIEGQQYEIADIGFRMLQPHELFKAQGFPDNYIFSYGIDERGNTVKLTKTEQTRMVGNSV